MTEHLSAEIVERFHQQPLIAAERIEVRDHLLKCESCRTQAIDTQISSVGISALSNHLVLDTDDEPFHLEYGTIVGYVYGTLDRVDQKVADMHLEDCVECNDEVTDLRESLVTMKAASGHQVEIEPVHDKFWTPVRLIAWSTPLRVSAIFALTLLTVVAAIVIWKFRSVKTPTPNSDHQFIAAPSSSPSELPKTREAASSPLSTPSESPRKKLANQPLAQDVIALNDGPNRIVLDESGNLRGLESLPHETQQVVREALIARGIKRPDILDELTSSQVSVRAPTGNDDAPKIVYPASRVITEDRPTFEWEPAKAASGYRVEIGDNQFRSVAKSDVLPPTNVTWTSPASLKRGVTYTWVVRVFKGDLDSAFVTAPRSFRILEDQRMKELDHLKTTSRSHLTLGIFYARQGMTTEAKHEFELLRRDNPQSNFIKKLLKTIRSW